MEQLLHVLQWIENLIWGLPLLVLLCGVGIFLTIQLKGLHIRSLFQLHRIKEVKAQEEIGEVSSFQSLMTAMASAVGTGSIVGVATAIMTGGLGALFWLWVTSFICMSIKYAESLLAVKYREVNKYGEMAGGPMYYIEKGLGWKWMAILFAIFGAVAAIGTGNMIQANAIAGAVQNVFHVDPLITGIVLALVTTFVLLRGIKSIGFVSSILVPVMALFYIAAGLIILCMYSSELPAAISLIISSAFTGQAATGGFLGATVMMAIQMGVSRSVLSSEAGVGISSIAAAAAKTSSSGRQAMLSMAATILSTAVICTITSLVIAVTQTMGSCDANGQLVNGASLAINAFNKAVPGGEYIVVFGLILFAYTTIIAWAYYGEKCFEYIFGKKRILFYRFLYLLVIVPGAIFALEIVWTFANITNGLMAIPNVIAILALSNVVKKETNHLLGAEETEVAQVVMNRELA
jgi:alanine or glycine:cation symporter, AGCS family